MTVTPNYINPTLPIRCTITHIFSIRKTSHSISSADMEIINIPTKYSNTILKKTSGDKKYFQVIHSFPECTPLPGKGLPRTNFSSSEASGMRPGNRNWEKTSFTTSIWWTQHTKPFVNYGVPTSEIIFSFPPEELSSTITTAAYTYCVSTAIQQTFPYTASI